MISTFISLFPLESRKGHRHDHIYKQDDGIGNPCRKVGALPC
jgi:hypothetical protein